MVDYLEDKLAEDILLLDLRGVSDFTDFFVLASGTSDRMLASLVDAVTEKTREQGVLKPYIEGNPDCGWMVLDYGSVVVHLLSPQMRDYYQLEELWRRGKVVLHLQ
ncbi:MAG TPA: ribosome silencing factor [Anaerolineaceae bacterium]|nr:ribosome silencing factor [Anaerolineaceae bacterium]HOF24745.1 ribosome silencing factor [Anaerolineaceae bacterium]HOR77581.1 ribosome silencing factor [Anaerolineaceae bacterium]HPK26253.1 ribosome silencing factor [Anaerolineaceae bacterium]